MGSSWAATSFGAHPPAVVWCSHPWQCGYLFLCGPLWARRGWPASQWSSPGPSWGSQVDTASFSFFSDLYACKRFFSHFFLIPVSEAFLGSFIPFLNTLPLPRPWAQPPRSGWLDPAGNGCVRLGQLRPPLMERPHPAGPPNRCKRNLATWSYFNRAAAGRYLSYLNDLC